MPDLIQELIAQHVPCSPSAPALLYKEQVLSYAELYREIERVVAGLLALDLNPGDRVAIYLPKLPQTVMSLFGAAAAGCVFVPVNPVLKAPQVGYILRDCNVKVLITAAGRFAGLRETLAECPDLEAVVQLDEQVEHAQHSHYRQLQWSEFVTATTERTAHRRIDADMAAILYTSGSTGFPKGVVLSHRNLVAGAQSVSTYLGNSADDRVLAILPLSFDAGLSQLTTMFNVGGSAVLMDYLLPVDVWRAVERYAVTGLAAVPPVWNQLVRLALPEGVAGVLRYITNTGGAMPEATTLALRTALPSTDIFLMYGLTEAFRSTYLPPEEINNRPGSIGKAIPNADILVINEQGQECEANEPGELVHRGALVAMGYWNAPEKTAERFRPAPGRAPGITAVEIAVWSGDQVRKDEQGYLYFVGRKDEMIKTSGYRVSPTEVESIIHSHDLVAETVAIGLEHPILGQAILALVVPSRLSEELEREILAHCNKQLPNYMVPQRVLVSDVLPRNQNGKIDRKSLADQYATIFQET